MKKVITLFTFLYPAIILGQTEFITTWKTDNPGTSNSTSITIPINPNETYNYSVDWDNDGVPDETNITGDVTHDFVTAGTYTIRITGTFPAIYFNNTGDKDKILNINQWGTGQWATMENTFFGCTNLNATATDVPNLSNVTNMSRLFTRATIFNGDISGWNTTNVTSMFAMFSSTNFNQDISSWNTSNVTNMAFMFDSNPNFNQNIGSWNTENVQTMQQMFASASSFNQDISNWNTSSLTNMSFMFYLANSFNQNIGSWDVSLLNSSVGALWGSNLSTNNYDALLIGWDAQILQPNVSFGADNLKFCSAAAVAARENIISNDNWSITDSGICAPLPFASDEFITVWKTDNAGFTTSNQIKIPTNPNETYNYSVDWGNDGVIDQANITGSIIHQFPSPGTYTIRITGNFPAIYFNNQEDKDKILAINQWSTGQWTTMENAFQGCTNLNATALDVPDLSNVTNMSSTFFGATNFNGDISGWDTSNVTNMSKMFLNASNFNQNIGNWNTANVNDMSQMFLNASKFNQNIGGWNTSNVTNMQSMFESATVFNQDIGGWNTNNVINMRATFARAAAFNQDLNWDTSNVTDMSLTFLLASSFNGDISGWNTANVTTMRGMFESTPFNKDITGASWNTANVTDMAFMFFNAESFNQNIGNWNVSSVQDMDGMFANASVFNQDISGWNTQGVNIMRRMFQNTTFNQDISGWNTGFVVNMFAMFQNSPFDQDIGSWNITNVLFMTDMFNGGGLSDSNYDSLLIGWNAQTLKPNVVFDAGNSKLCSTSALNARANMITGDNWTINDAGQCATLSIKSFENTIDFDMYPNPSSGFTQIKLGAYFDEISITIYDILGKKIFTKDYLNTDFITINLDNFSQGIYTIKIKSEDKTATSKLIIQ